MAFDLAQQLAAAPAGGVVAVPAGTYAVNLTIDKPVRLVAMGRVVLDGLKQGPVLVVDAPGAVVLSGFFIVGGDCPDGGGGVRALSGQLEVLDCTFRHNAAPLNGGGALLATHATRVQVQRCRFEANTGRQGGALLADEEAVVTVADSLLVQNAAVWGGAVRAREAAQVTVTGCTLADNKVVGELAAGGAISLSGSSTRRPQVRLEASIVSERASGPGLFHNGPTFPGQIEVRGCLAPPWATDLGEGCTVGEVRFCFEGAEPYRLDKASSGLASAASPVLSGGKDVLGAARRPDGTGRVLLGAYGGHGS